MVSAIDDKTFEEIVHLREEIKRLRQSLNRLTPGMDVLLRRRGFRIYKREPPEDLLLPSEEQREEYYRMLHKYSFRLFLRDVIKHQDFLTLDNVTRYATLDVAREYIKYAAKTALIEKKNGSYALMKRPVVSFGPTLEWYIAEVFKREFGSEAVWGVKFRRPKVGGDYDVIAKFDGSLFYLEVKSSPPKQIYDSEISAFLDRVADLSPEIAVFFMDTELRMKDKIVPMFENELKKRFLESHAVIRMERELFEIDNRIFIINAKESIIRNIEKVAYRYYRQGTNIT
jgi:hypothetical protein